MIQVHIKVLKHFPKEHLRKNRLEEKKMITHYPILRCGKCHSLTVIFFPPLGLQVNCIWGKH